MTFDENVYGGYEVQRRKYRSMWVKKAFQTQDPSNPDNYTFFWPISSRPKIEEILKKASDGSFCLRRSRDKNLCLSIKHRSGNWRLLLHRYSHFLVIHLRLVESEDGKCSIGYGNYFDNLGDFLAKLATKQLELRHEVQSKAVKICLQFQIDYDPNIATVKKPVPVSSACTLWTVE